jgi:hypothetical protein
MQLSEAGDAFVEYVVDVVGHGEGFVDVDTKEAGSIHALDGGSRDEDV